jgi:hypothetical protein
MLYFQCFLVQRFEVRLEVQKVKQRSRVVAVDLSTAAAHADWRLLRLVLPEVWRSEELFPP